MSGLANTALHLTASSLRYAALRSSFRQQVGLGVSQLELHSSISTILKNWGLS
jgi:hypothetical protein